jgi:hypothetical protein
MAVRRHPTSLLLALPKELAIEIFGHLATTSERSMDDLRNLRVTCSSMCHICNNLIVGQHVALHHCRHGLGWDDLGNYYAFLASLTQLGNLKACFLTGILIVFEENHRPPSCLDNLASAADGGHNLETYLVAILLYRHNGNAHDDDTTRQYMRRVEGEEELWAVVADQRVSGYATRGVPP